MSIDQVRPQGNVRSALTLQLLSVHFSILLSDLTHAYQNNHMLWMPDSKTYAGRQYGWPIFGGADTDVNSKLSDIVCFLIHSKTSLYILKLKQNYMSQIHNPELDSKTGLLLQDFIFARQNSENKLFYASTKGIYT